MSSDDDESEDEVMNLDSMQSDDDDSQQSDDDNSTEQDADSNESDSASESETEEADAGDWGKKKNTYWSGDTADLEIGQEIQDAEDEEAAAMVRSYLSMQRTVHTHANQSMH